MQTVECFDLADGQSWHIWDECDAKTGSLTRRLGVYPDNKNAKSFRFDAETVNAFNRQVEAHGFEKIMNANSSIVGIALKVRN